MAILGIVSLTGVFFSSCNKGTNQDNIVSQRYIHKYGYPVSKQEWEAKRLPGQVVTTLKNGVTITSTYENGILNGPSTHSYAHSQILENYFLYDQGNLVKEIKYDPRGMPVKETVQHSPTRYTTTLWYADGTPMSKEEYLGDELIDGEYYTTFNELESRVEKGNGIRIRKDQKGTLLSKDQFEGGYLVKRESYYPTGTPQSIAYYQKGKLHGEKKAFNENGEPLVIEEYVDDMLHGKSTFFKNGSKAREVSYIQGRKNGVEVHYLDGDKASQEISWVDDKQHGPCTFYIDGEANHKWFYDGQEVSARRYKDLNKLDEIISRIPDEVRADVR